MSKEIYRSANGKTVDMGALRLKNEKVRAIGNMKVNARGDEIDDRGRVIRKKTEQVNNQYQRQVKAILPSSKPGDNDV
jgi:hypothetical protein